MDPFSVLVTAARIGITVLFLCVLVWAAHQRAAAHDITRQGLRHRHTHVATVPGRVAAGTAARLV